MSDEDQLLANYFASLTTRDESVVSFEGQKLRLDSAGDGKKISAEIDAAETMETLILTGNTIGVEAAKEIANSIVRHRELRRAVFDDIFTSRTKEETPLALKHICRGLEASNCALTELNLRDNAVSVVGAQAIEAFLSSPACFHLETIRLDNDGLGITGGKIVANALLRCQQLARSQGTAMRLKAFSAGRNRLEDKGAKAFAKAFKAIGTLEMISLPQNGINAAGITALSKAFKFNLGLKYIDLTDNTLNLKGSLALADVLCKMNCLEVLNLADSLVKPVGAIAIALGLKSASLKMLCLNGCELNANACLGVLELISYRKDTLQRICLDGNEIGEMGLLQVRSCAKRYKIDAFLAPIEEDAGSTEELDEEDEGKSDGSECSDEERPETGEEKVLPEESDRYRNERWLKTALRGRLAKSLYDARADDSKILHQFAFSVKWMKGLLPVDFHDLLTCVDHMLPYMAKRSMWPTVLNNLLSELGVMKFLRETEDDNEANLEDRSFEPVLTFLEYLQVQPYVPKTERRNLKSVLQKLRTKVLSSSIDIEEMVKKFESES